MTHFILYVAMSLDGYIARSDQRVDWLPSPDDADDHGYTQFYNSIDALVMGSTTYEQVLGFGDWAYPGKQSYVLTSRTLSTPRDDVTCVNGGISQVIIETQQRGFHRVWIVGGGQVASAFMQQGLVDEYIIVFIPIILGTGIPLYRSVPEQQLELVTTNTYSTGAVELRYKKKM